jgi:DNA-binding NtrC family response regulator
MSTPEQGSAVVLVADGEERVLQQVSTTLEKAGFTVFTALGRSAALDFCRNMKEPVQLAIIDMAMGASGPELVQELYHSYPDVRVLFTSNQDQPDAIQQAGPSGRFRGFLKKPFRRSKLLGSVLKAMDAPLARTA